MKTIVTKGEFAAMKGRKPSAVSNWIADGRITPAALMGSGVRARIWVEQAERDLARNLDPSQQIAQERPMPLAAPASGGEGAVAPVVSAAPVQAEDEDLRRRRKADADAAEHNAALAQLKREREAGRWVDKEEQARAFARELSQLTSSIESFVTQKLARAVSERFGLDVREVQTEMRTLWRELRTTTAEAAEPGADNREG